MIHDNKNKRFRIHTYSSPKLNLQKIQRNTEVIPEQMEDG